MLLTLCALAFASEGEGASHGGVEAAGAGAEGVHIPWDTIGIQAVNVVLFLAVLIWVARGPIGDALKNRSLAVRQQLDEAARLKAEAEARAAEVEAKLASLDKRIAEMKAEADRDAEREARRIEERAQADAARIKDTAERTIREEAARARNELRGEAARLAVQLARETLRRAVTPDDQERLARELLAAVEEEPTNG